MKRNSTIIFVSLTLLVMVAVVSAWLIIESALQSSSPQEPSSALVHKLKDVPPATEPESSSTLTLNYANSELLQMTQIAKEQRRLRENYSNGFQNEKNVLRSHKRNTTSAKIKKQVESYLTEIELLESGPAPAIAVRRIADANSDNCLVLNEVVWSVYERTEMYHETLRSDLLDSLFYAIDLAIQADPYCANAHDTKAHLLEINGDLREAIRFSERAIELTPETNESYKQYREKLYRKKFEAEAKIARAKIVSPIIAKNIKSFRRVPGKPKDRQRCSKNLCRLGQAALDHSVSIH